MSIPESHRKKGQIKSNQARITESGDLETLLVLLLARLLARTKLPMELAALGMKVADLPGRHSTQSSPAALLLALPPLLLAHLLPAVVIVVVGLVPTVWLVSAGVAHLEAFLVAPAVGLAFVEGILRHFFAFLLDPWVVLAGVSSGRLLGDGDAARSVLVLGIF